MITMLLSYKVGQRKGERLQKKRKKKREMERSGKDYGVAGYWLTENQEKALQIGGVGLVALRLGNP